MKALIIEKKSERIVELCRKLAALDKEAEIGLCSDCSSDFPYADLYVVNKADYPLYADKFTSGTEPIVVKTQLQKETAEYCFVENKRYDNATTDKIASLYTETEKMAETVMNTICVKWSNGGSNYLKHAIVTVAKDPPSYRRKLSALVYPEIGKAFGLSTLNVEHSIRHVINGCHNNKTLANVNGLFDIKLVDEKYPPSNGEFIFAVAEQINFRQRNGDSLKSNRDFCANYYGKY